MDLTDFNCSYLNKLLENISKEEKSVFVLGDLNVNLLNYNKHNQTNEFIQTIFSVDWEDLLKTDELNADNQPECIQI